MATTLDNFSVKKDDLKLERPATFEELGMDPQNKGILSVFLELVRAEELCKSLGMNDKLNCLVCHSPGTDKSSIIAAMADYLLSSILLKNLGLGSRSLHTLTDSIYSLKRLGHLSLKGSNLSHLPSEIGNLVLLKTLSLEGNNICTKLERLQVLECNQLGLEMRCMGTNKLAENNFANPLLKSASSSHCKIGLPDGRHIVVLDPLKKSTKNIAHAVWVDQCSPTVSLPEKKMVRKTLKRKCKTMSEIFEIHQQHFGRRCEGSAKSFRAMQVGRKHGTNRISTVKRIHKQHRIHKWPFRQKWATRKGYSARDKRSFEVSSLSKTEKLDSRFQFSHMSQCAKADESGPAVSNSEKGSMREALKRDSLKDLLQHFGARHKDAAKGLCDSLAWKSFEVLDSLPLAEQSNSIRNLAWRRTLTHKHCVRLKKSKDLPLSLLSDCLGELAAQSAIGLTDGGHIPSLSKKKIVRKTLKRNCRNMSILSLDDHQQHVGRRWEDDAKFLGAKRIRRQLVIHCESMAKHIHRQLVIHRESMAKCINRQHGIRRWPFKQSAISLPDGGHILSLPKKKIARKTLKTKCSTVSVFRFEYHQHNSTWEDVVKGLGTKRICRQLVIHRVYTVKRVPTQHGIHWWPFQQNWVTMKGYSSGDERPVEVICLSTDGKLVSRFQLIQISWLGRFSPRPSALQGGVIVEHIALSSSEFAGTNNSAHHVRQDQSGSTASHLKKKRTREQEDCEERNENIELNDLKQHYGRKREDAAKSLGVSVSTLKRICRQNGIMRWPYSPRNNAVKKPPDKHGGMNASEARKTLSTNGSNPDSSQLMPTISHTAGSSEDWRNLLASLEEPLLQGHVSSCIYRTISSCTDPAPSQTIPIVPHPTGNLEDQINLLALPEEPLLSQLTPSIPPTIDGFADLGPFSSLFDDSFPEGIDYTVPACSDPAPSQTTPPNATEMQNMDFVELKATYDDGTFGNTTIKFQLPPKFETSELKERVSKILECELDSFKVEYKDKDEEWILMGCEENVREYLQLLNSLGKQVTKLKITKVPNTTNLCETCGSSLTRKRPRHVQM